MMNFNANNMPINIAPTQLQNDDKKNQYPNTENIKEENVQRSKRAGSDEPN